MSRPPRQRRLNPPKKVNVLVQPRIRGFNGPLIQKDKVSDPGNKIQKDTQNP
jgi:hypothetical protein